MRRLLRTVFILSTLLSPGINQHFSLPSNPHLPIPETFIIINPEKGTSVGTISPRGEIFINRPDGITFGTKHPGQPTTLFEVDFYKPSTEEGR